MIMKTLSVVIISFNEEKRLAKCLEAARQVSDEIILVDSHSTDGTVAIAQSFGASIHLQEFLGYVGQKNFAKDLAKMDYVLSLDCDEILSNELINSILNIKYNNIQSDGFLVNRLNLLEGKPIKSCGWYPDSKLRLWKNGMARWVGHTIHEKVEMDAGSIVKHLEGDLIHDTYPTRESFERQVVKFSDIAAQHFKNKSYIYLVFKLCVSTPYKFIKSYFLKKGFTEGNAGFFVAKMQTKEVFLKYLKAIHLKKQPSINIIL